MVALVGDGDEDDCTTNADLSSRFAVLQNIRCTRDNTAALHWTNTHVSSVVLILSQNAVYCQISIALQSPFWADIVPPEWPSFPSNSFIKSDSDEWHNFEIPSSSR